MENMRQIKSLSTYRYNKYYFEDLNSIEDKPRFIEKKFEYDENGNLVEESYYQESGELDHRINRAFDKSNDLNRLNEELLYYSDDEVAESLVLNRDSNGLVVLKEKEYSEGGKTETFLNYNENNQLIHQITQDSDGELEEEEFFVYENGNLVEHKLVDCFGKVQHLEKMSYNESNQVVEQIVSDDEVYEQIKRFYEGENLTSIEIYDKQGNGIRKLEYLYNELNQNIEINERGKFGARKVKFEYDEDGNEVLEETFNSSGELIQKVKKIFIEGNRNVLTSYWIENKDYGMINSFSVVSEYTYF